MGQNEANPKNRNSRYLAAAKGIWLNFLLDSESAILFFKTGWFNRSGPRPLMFLRNIWAVAFWQTDTVQTHSRIVRPSLFVIPKLDGFEGAFVEEVDHV